jgi:hypothetical protein
MNEIKPEEVDLTRPTNQDEPGPTKFMIVGHVDHGTTTALMAARMMASHKVEVITHEEAEKLGVLPTPYKARPIGLTKVLETEVQSDFINKKSARNVRREQERKNKKRK